MRFAYSLLLVCGPAGIAAQACTSANPGSYCSSGYEVQCPRNYYCPGGSYSYIACSNGDTSNAGATNANDCYSYTASASLAWWSLLILILPILACIYCFMRGRGSGNTTVHHWGNGQGPQGPPWDGQGPQWNGGAPAGYGVVPAYPQPGAYAHARPEIPYAQPADPSYGFHHQSHHPTAPPYREPTAPPQRYKEVPPTVQPQYYPQDY